MGGDNKIARILKGYGIINAIATLIVTWWIWEESDIYEFWWLILAGGLVASFAIYAFGEVVQILHDIRANTAESNKWLSKNSDK